METFVMLPAVASESMDSFSALDGSNSMLRAFIDQE
jgi:hypothetical protein